MIFYDVFDEEAYLSSDKVMANLLSISSGVRMSGTLYMYTESLKVWSPLRSPGYCKVIASIVSSNVSVNYDVASRPYIDRLDMISWPSIVLQPSVCMGFRRYLIGYHEGNVYYTEYVISSEHIADKTVCVMPIPINPVPRVVPILSRSKIEDALGATYGSSLDSFMWVIGNSLVDPCQQPMMTLILGASSTGKSTSLDIIDSILPRLLGAIDTRYIREDRPFSRDDVNAIMSHRLIVLSDIEFGKSQINTQFLKVLAGGEKVNVGDLGSVRLARNAIGTTNSMPRIQSMSEWCKLEICCIVILWLGTLS